MLGPGFFPIIQFVMSFSKMGTVEDARIERIFFDEINFAFIRKSFFSKEMDTLLNFRYGYPRKIFRNRSES